MILLILNKNIMSTVIITKRKNMNKSKIAFAAATALLLTSAYSHAQTTVGGNMRIGLKGTKAANNAIGSGTLFTKETQINIANKGSLNIAGVTYAAGFSIENDGGDTGTTGTHFENNYIDIINASSGTTITFSSDHLKPSDVEFHDIIAGPQNLGHATAFVASASGATVDTFYNRDIAGKGKKEGFGAGIMQDIGTFGKFNFIYQPDTAVALGDTGAGTMSGGSTTNSFYDTSFRGSLGVKGLDIVLGMNKQEGTGTDKDVKFDTQGIKYTLNQFTVGLQRADGTYNATGSTMKSKELGLAYAVTKDLSLGYSMIKVDESNTGPNEKSQGITVGYSLGPVSVTAIAAKVDNALGVDASDGKSFIVNLGTTF
jgi:hypothetical protein